MQKTTVYCVDSLQKNFYFSLSFPLYEESEKNYCYIRELGKEKLLVLCSFSEEEQLVELPDEFFGRKGITLISNYDKLIDLNNCIEDEKTVLLKAYEARVIYYN